MADYVLLYTGGSVPESEEEQVGVMQAWTDFYQAIGEAIKDGGNPFGPAKTVAADGSVSDGVSGVPHTGYTIVTADSLEAATEMAKGAPVLTTGGGVTVYETFEVM